MSFTHDRIMRAHRFGAKAFGYGIFLTVHPQWVQLTWGALDE